GDLHRHLSDGSAAGRVPRGENRVEDRDMSTLADKVSVVTGSTSGIGRGIAEHFASLGSNVVVHGRDRADGLETVRRVKAAGRDAEYVDGDLTLGAYSVSKGGLMTLTKNAASLLNRDRIRVNQFNVGWTLTEGERRVKREEEGKNDDWIAQAIATRPFGRLLAPIDIAYAAAYFASDESGCVTGSVLDLEQYPPGALANS